jgi:hypothetical protein
MTWTRFSALTEQVTERYTRAIEQLRSDKVDVWIGGVYAPERVACDSARDHPTVMDVRAAVTVVGRGAIDRNLRPVDLEGANLTRADLTVAPHRRVPHLS